MEGGRKNEILSKKFCFLYSYRTSVNSVRGWPFLESENKARGSRLDAVEQSGSPFLFQSIIQGLM